MLNVYFDVQGGACDGGGERDGPERQPAHVREPALLCRRLQGGGTRQPRNAVMEN